jgi:hypothetical protein
VDWLSAHAPALLAGGLCNLAAYLAAHVLLCLLPASFIAGAMTALIPKESVTRFLGRNTPGLVSYPAVAAAGSLLAVCSCTIVPLFAGIYAKGAGIGPAMRPPERGYGRDALVGGAAQVDAGHARDDVRDDDELQQVDPGGVFGTTRPSAGCRARSTKPTGSMPRYPCRSDADRRWHLDWTAPTQSLMIGNRRTTETRRG